MKTSRFFPLNFAVSIILCCAGLFPAQGRADVTFFDGTFNKADWSEMVFTNGNGGGSSAVHDSGGFYRVTTYCNNGPSCGAGIYLRNAFTFSPAAQGAVFSLDYSVDLIAVNLYGEAEPVAYQNGKVYFGSSLYTTAGTWQTLTQSNLTALSFALLIKNPNGELGADVTNHPDFSTAGAPITFGFIVPDSAIDSGYTTVGGVDNYTLNLHVQGTLAIGLTNGLTSVSWPTSTIPYQLESATNLTAPAWVLAGRVPVLTGGRYLVTNHWTEPARFFRLAECDPAPSGIVSWWTADGTASDLIGTNHGILNGGVTYTSGEVRQAFNLNGTTAWVNVPHSDSFNPTGPFSIECWVNGNPIQNYAQSLIVDKSHGFTDGTGWGLQTDPSGSGKPQFFYGTGQNAGSFPLVSANATVLDNHWHHLAGVWTGTQLQIYLDGALQDTLNETTLPANNLRDVEIGRSWGGGTPIRFFRGKIDEVSYYNRALSGSEVAAIFNAGSGGKCSP